MASLVPTTLWIAAPCQQTIESKKKKAKKKQTLLTGIIDANFKKPVLPGLIMSAWSARQQPARHEESSQLTRLRPWQVLHNKVIRAYGNKNHY